MRNELLDMVWGETMQAVRPECLFPTVDGDRPCYCDGCRRYWAEGVYIPRVLRKEVMPPRRRFFLWRWIALLFKKRRDLPRLLPCAPERCNCPDCKMGRSEFIPTME